MAAKQILVKVVVKESTDPYLFARLMQADERDRAALLRHLSAMSCMMETGRLHSAPAAVVIPTAPGPAPTPAPEKAPEPEPVNDVARNMAKGFLSLG